MEELSAKLKQRLEEYEAEYTEAERLSQAVEVCQDSKLLEFYSSKLNHLRPVVLLHRRYQQINSEIEIAKELLRLEKDVQKSAEIKQEIEKKSGQLAFLIEEINLTYQELSDKTSEDTRIEVCNIGGEQIEENLLKMIKQYCEQSGFSFKQVPSKSNSIVLNINGDNSYKKLSRLSGLYLLVSRGKEETASLLVFHNPSPIDRLDDSDIRAEYSKSSGAGGQHINKTESAVKLIHVPTGISAECQDERSQSKNRQRAYENLTQKVLSFYQKNSKNQYEFEKKQQKNAIFSKTPKFIIDFDKNKFINFENKQNYNLAEVLSGNLTSLINDLGI